MTKRYHCTTGFYSAWNFFSWTGVMNWWIEMFFGCLFVWSSCIVKWDLKPKESLAVPHLQVRPTWAKICRKAQCMFAGWFFLALAFVTPLMDTEAFPKRSYPLIYNAKNLSEQWGECYALWFLVVLIGFCVLRGKNALNLPLGSTYPSKSHAFCLTQTRFETFSGSRTWKENTHAFYTNARFVTLRLDNWWIKILN